jgi:hypothetical protein
VNRAKKEAEDSVDRGSTPREAGTQELPVTPCERCGAPARVHVLAGYVEGRPVHRHFCHACADVAYELQLEVGVGRVRPRPRVSSLIIAVGVLFAVLGASFDLLGIEGAAGFGWQQQGGMAVGVLLVILGGLLRVDAIAIAGALLFGAAALADVYGTLGSPGIGLKQQFFVAAGVSLILAGIWLRRRKRQQRLAGAN